MVTDRDCDSIAAQNQLSSPLLRLPAELRNRIYKEVFAPRIARVVPRSVIKGYTTWPFTALHVCRQVRHEAKPIMFASITFDFRALEPIVDPATILTLGSFEAIVVGSKLVWYVSNAMGHSGGYPERFKSLQKVYWGTLQSPIKLFWRRGSGGVVTL